MNLNSLLFVFCIVLTNGSSVGRSGGTSDDFALSANATSADLVFLVDVTGSMGSYITAVKTAIEQIVENANKQEIALRLAFIGYRDPFGNGRIPEMTDELEREEFAVLQPTKSIREFKAFVSGVRATGGGDGPEDVFGGLEKAGNLQWNPESSKRVLFHIADAPAHGSQYGGDGGFDAGDPLERDLETLLMRIKEAGVQYNFGKVNSETEVMLAAFSEVWGSPIPQFTVASSNSGRRPMRARGRGVGGAAMERGDKEEAESEDAWGGEGDEDDAYYDGDEDEGGAYYYGGGDEGGESGGEPATELSIADKLVAAIGKTLE